jgi:hypothetical protein
MEEAQVGWIAAIIIGGIAGWLAEQFMHSNMGMFMNIISASSVGPEPVGCLDCSASALVDGSAMS